MHASPLRLLLVEDESDHANLIARYLQRAGDYELTLVATAAEALRALAQRSFDIILLDYFLPDLNGLEFLQRCRDLPVVPPIIMVTGQGDERIAVEAMKRGAADYVIKSGDYFSTISHVISRTLEQGRLRRRAAQSEANYRRLFHTLADPILLVDLDTLEIVKCNRQTRLALGIGARPRPGGRRHGLKLTDILRRNGKPLSAGALRKLSSGKSVVEFNCQLLDGNNNLREVSLHVSSTNYGPSAAGSPRRVLLVLVRDVTERHQLMKKLQDSENRYRTIVDNALTGFFQSTLDGRLLMANTALARMFGYASTEELLAVDIKKELYFNPEEREKLLAHILTQGQAQNLESTLRKKDGTPIIVRENVRVVRNEQGDIAYFEGILQDITEQKQLAAQLLQSQKMESIGRLAGGIAHDFNNILMGIIGYISLALDDMKPGDRHYDDLRQVEKTAQRAAEITRQLLAYSRKTVRHPEAVAANALIEETLQLFKRAAPPTLRVSTQLDHNLPTILIDALQFQQVLMNLFMNANDAIAAAPDAFGGGTIEIRSSVRMLTEAEAAQMVDARPGPYVVISVRDSGVGVAREDLARIFEPFYTTKGVGQGTGLGLAMVYGIVKAHSGLIQVDSEKSQGTEFRLLFPAYDGVTAATREIEEELPPGTETILLVDDEETLTAVGKRILEKFGYEVITARDGVQALEFYLTHQNDIDLVLLDMTMPKMDGPRLLRELVRVNPQVKAVMYSGYSHPTDADELLQSGSRRFLQKPYRPEELVRTIREVLDGLPAAGKNSSSVRT